MAAEGSFVKDSKTGVVININDNEYERHKMAREKAIREMKSKTEIEDIRRELQSIKIVINKILEIVSKETN